MTLKEKIENRSSGILLYGLTPPKKKTSIEKVIEISGRQIAAINSIGVDGLVLYDIHDEKDRNEEDRRLRDRSCQFRSGRQLPR